MTHLACLGIIHVIRTFLRAMRLKRPPPLFIESWREREKRTLSMILSVKIIDMTFFMMNVLCVDVKVIGTRRVTIKKMLVA